MYISKFQVFHYKSFIDSGLLKFTPSINIIVGQNNAGKTALLEALTLNFEHTPHKSIKTLPTKSSVLKEKSWARVSFFINKDEFISLLDLMTYPIKVPHPAQHTITEHETAYKFQDWINSPHPVELNLSITNRNTFWETYETSSDLTFGIYEPQIPLLLMSIKNTIDSPFDYYGSFPNNNLNDNLAFNILNVIKPKIYRFYAERLNVGICSVGYNSELNQNASNLAEVLGVLQGSNPSRFERFNKLVSVILPQIKRIALQPRPNNQVEIMVWHIDTSTERDDLAFPLSSCGTGIGQVLAILYVVLNSQDPRTIIIDEPQSFLHPGAAKKLIEILKDFPQHQYFIATHSPTIISAANPSKIVILRYEDSETKASELDAKETTEQRSLLAEVGANLSDVFGADNILWVEGPTEERCFPLILQKVAKKPLRGTTILSVKNTGDLDGKRAEIIFEIYDKLSGGASLFPPAIGFIFDSEGKSETKIQDLKRRSQNPVEFLPRRMYENYLLYPEAIAAVINEADKNRDVPITVVKIEQWLEKKKQENAYLPKGLETETISDNEWLSKVDSANLLKKLFEYFCETRLVFSKTTHSFKLTQWLVDNAPEQLSELSELLEKVLS